MSTSVPVPRIEEHLGLARSIAARWRGRIEGYELEDLYHECWLVLHQAAAAWRPGRIRFGTFAYICLERRLARLASVARLVRAPRGAAPLRSRPLDAQIDPAADEPIEFIELADFVGLTLPEFRALIDAPPRVDSPLATRLRGRYLAALSQLEDST